MLVNIEIVDSESGDREMLIRLPFARMDDERVLAQLADPNVKYLNFTSWAQQRNSDLVERVNTRGQGMPLYAEFANPADPDSTIELPLSGGVKISAINPAWQRAENLRKAEEARVKSQQVSPVVAAEAKAKAERVRALEAALDAAKREVGVLA